ncbi:hypothetical protein, variant [Verruconis gallopava]|uniref:Beige protein homolog 1 n=1 Tax=Verruconis gallopava TaxID=253628 RepID=A0A0D1XPQ2_9PEZI|nr:hypothetical protein, variant [Verruconis gallopava]KIW04511.1 hypothetical protein, variant [Verruconis gallopava]
MAEDPLAADLNAAVESIEALLAVTAPQPISNDRIQSLCIQLRHIQQALIERAGTEGDSINHARNTFRHVNGFEVLLRVLRSVSGYYDAEKLSQDERAEFFELLKTVFNVLSEGLGEHSGNRRYFAKRVEDGGWRALEQALISSGLAGSSDDASTGMSQLFGLLVSFALADDTFQSIFKNYGMAQTSGFKAESTPDDITKEVKKMFTGNELLRNSEIVPTIFSFWQLFLASSDSSSNSSLSAAVISALDIISGISVRNCVKMHEAGLLGMLLPYCLDDSTHVQPAARPLILQLCQNLIKYGVGSLDDASLLYKQAQRSDVAAQFLLDALHHSRPQFIQFDLSLHGYCSVELPTLGRIFPPPNTGYTISTWVCVDEFDDSCHTTLFGAYDHTQTSFILLYLEKDSHHLILQTSVTANRPSVRFKSVHFNKHEWYHIALVHERPRFKGSSSAHLYVNGRYVEKQKVLWPSPPPTSADPSGAPRVAAVQAFLGTPQNLAPRIGRNVWHSKWSMASFHLIYMALNDDIIAVYRHLGPRYSGNYQDMLASFMTYKESAAMNRQNENMHPGNEEGSDMSKMTRQKASNMVPESAFALSFSPMWVLDNEDANNVNETRLNESLSRDASKMLKRLIRACGQAVMLNAAIPSINAALTHPHGVAILTGEPVVSVPQSLDETSWRLAGSAATGLKLVELANTKDSVLRATEILFSSLSSSWRNSEAIERDGYQVLAGILREKLGMSSIFGDNGVAPRARITAVDVGDREELALELLRLILRFVGYNEREPKKSLMINPLAYRVLLIDFDTWRRAPIATQKIYYGQFLHFASSDCMYHRFNVKRLIRMRMVKQLLNALKGESFSKDVFPDFLEAFTALLQCNVTGDNLRSLALFVTYAFQDSRAFPNRSFSRGARDNRSSPLHTLQSSAHSTPRSTSPGTNNGIPMNAVTPYEVGVKVLEVMTDLLCSSSDTENIMKFAKTVSNRWLQFQLDERDDERVIVLTTRLLFRVLVIQGPEYTKRYAEKYGGFTILKHKLKFWWNTPALWTLCFALMFRIDPALISLDQDFNLFTLMDIFSRSQLQVANPEVMIVITGMLEYGLHELIQKGYSAPQDGSDMGTGKSDSRFSVVRERSMSLNVDKFSRASSRSSLQRLAGDAEVLNTVINFMRDLYTESPAFKEWAATSTYLQQLLFVLYPVIVTADKVSAETELQSRGGTLTFEGKEVVMRPHLTSENLRPPSVRTTNVDPPPSPTSQRSMPFRRASSFVLISTDKETLEAGGKHARFNAVISPSSSAPVELRVSNGVAEGLLKVITNVLLDQILRRKDFNGFGLFLKVPPGFQEHQAYFESFVLKEVMTSLTTELRMNYKDWPKEPRIITNLSRYASHMAEALFEGWFIGALSAEPLLEFVGQVLEHLQRPDIRCLKSVRLCDASVHTLQRVCMRIMLYQLSSVNEVVDEKGALAFMKKMTFWQPVILASEETLPMFLRLVFYLLYVKYCSPITSVRIAALDFWRSLLVQKPHEASRVLTEALHGEHKHLGHNFMNLAELDNDAFMVWTDTFKGELDAMFTGSLAKDWENFVADQNKETEKTAEGRISKRREKLKMWRDEELKAEATIREHDNAGGNWRRNIYVSERLKHQRALQDQQDNLTYTSATLNRFDQVLKGPCSLYEKEQPPKWRLDETEGEHRMRLRVVPDRLTREDYQPKRKASSSLPKKQASLKLDTNVSIPSTKDLVGPTPAVTSIPNSILEPGRQRAGSASNSPSTMGPAGAGEEDYEVIEDPKQDEDGFEDKNRRVMRALERGDQIQHLFNVSRIIALEACEGLLIFGKQCLYLIDNFLQRADGEVIRVWQATAEERDPYLQLLPDQDAKKGKLRQSITDQTSRHWRWSDVMVVSKRSFLLRDVALELFFTDGRSYLLTARSKEERDALYKKLTERAPHLVSSSVPPFPEDAWRLDSWRHPEEMSQGFLAKLTNSGPRAATKQWQSGEMSNFHYLMLLNTMAGRSFNDLTQYPVFPWVLADYTSEELDLSNPKTFRDLSKPMGCQTPGTDVQARERYLALKDIGGDIGPYHFSTHYSSATTVSSYLIRLQPFVQAYVAVQGGKFDVADRMFGSIRGAWEGASGINAQDVRELTPEFFYLPEFLVNHNKYSFGTTASGHELNHVELPPWAKGSPEIFIAKHREALESPIVSMHLHKWIDLIFGYKQTGQAAIDALNLFHPYSYAGARNLDEVEDADTRKSMANIIHSFGQTPTQLFTKPHPSRDELAHPFVGLDTSADLLKGPSGILQIPEKVAHMSEKQGKLHVSGPFRLHIPPNYDKFIDWGFVDGSLRFFSDDGKKLLAMFEHLHIGQVSTALFADSRTLITAGSDCVVSIWNVEYPSRSVNLVLRTSLFGHRRPVTALTSSNRFMTLLSSDTSGRVLMWDLNRNDFVREIEKSGTEVRMARISNETGDILLARGRNVKVTSLNGVELLEQQVCVEPEDEVMSIAWVNARRHEWLDKCLFLTGHRLGYVKIWEKVVTRDGKWAIVLVRSLDAGLPNREMTRVPITSVLIMRGTVYAGDDAGRVFSWRCSDE